MFDDFDPKEKKVIVICLALVALAIGYVYTHDLPWDHIQRVAPHEAYDPRNPFQQNQNDSYRRNDAYQNNNDAYSSGTEEDYIPPDEEEKRPYDQNPSYESFL